MHGLTALPLADCVGRGTGLDDRGLERKRAILASACKRRPPPQDPIELLAEFGGYEIAMLTGALLGAAARRHLIIVDGFTVTVAAALAARIDPHVLDYCIFGHCSAEHAHRALLAHLHAEPLLDLGMRLGEGSGAAVALPVVRAAVAPVHADGDLRRRRCQREERMSRRSLAMPLARPRQLVLFLLAAQFLTTIADARVDAGRRERVAAIGALLPLGGRAGGAHQRRDLVAVDSLAAGERIDRTHARDLVAPHRCAARGRLRGCLRWFRRGHDHRSGACDHEGLAPRRVRRPRHLRLARPQVDGAPRDSRCCRSPCSWSARTCSAAGSPAA